MTWQIDADGVQQWVADKGVTSPSGEALTRVNPDGHPVQEGSLGIDQQSYLWKGSDGYYITPYNGEGTSEQVARKVPGVTDANIPGILSGAATVSKQADAANKVGFNRDVGFALALMGGTLATNMGAFGTTPIAGAGTPGGAASGADLATLGVGLPTEAAAGETAGANFFEGMTAKETLASQGLIDAAPAVAAKAASSTGEKIAKWVAGQVIGSGVKAAVTTALAGGKGDATALPAGSADAPEPFSFGTFSSLSMPSAYKKVTRTKFQVDQAGLADSGIAYTPR